MPVSLSIDGSPMAIESRSSGIEFFAARKSVVALRVDGELRDLATDLATLPEGSVVESVDISSQDGLNILRHSTAHVLAQAVQQVYPDARLGIGPFIEDGFYYDFGNIDAVTPELLRDLEKRMKRIVKEGQTFRRREVSDADAAAERVAQIDAANRAAYEDGRTGISSGSIGADSLGDGFIGHPITGALTVTSPFGFRVHPVTGVGTGHQGTDFAASEGTPQYAAVSGTATYWDSASCGIGIDINAGYIDGHSYVITLCHLSGRVISDGQYVSRGDVVGYTGSTGYATGPHVHFQVARDGTYIDPMTLPGF